MMAGEPRGQRCAWTKRVPRRGRSGHPPCILFADHSPLYFFPEGRWMVGRWPFLSLGSAARAIGNAESGTLRHRTEAFWDPVWNSCGKMRWIPKS